MSDELVNYGFDSYIEEFAGAGPKNYAYKAWSTDKQEYITVCKVKGIRLCHTASQTVNFETIKEMLTQADNPEPVYVTSTQIRRTNEHNIISQPETKMYRPVAEKRHFTDDYDSYPYGYKRIKVEHST